MPTSTQQAVSDLEFNSSLCDSEGCMHSFHNTRSSQSNCLSESRGNNVQIPGPYTRSPESESTLGLGGGGARWWWLARMFGKSSGQSDDQPGV